MSEIFSRSSTTTSNSIPDSNRGSNSTSGSGEIGGNPPRGRGRGSRGNRGGLGKYLRARGRGHRGGGRPAEFRERLVLDGEGGGDGEDHDDEEGEGDGGKKYTRRHLGSNEDRYVEPDPELDSDGEPILEPEIDLSSFLAKQKLYDDSTASSNANILDTTKLSQEARVREEEEQGDVDHTLDHLFVSGSGSYRKVGGGSVRGGGWGNSSKGKTKEIEWDEEFEELLREKKSVEAARDLKSRFKAKSSTLAKRPAVLSSRDRKQELSYTLAPPLPLPPPEGSKPKSEMDEMEEFLDELLE